MVRGIPWDDLHLNDDDNDAINKSKKDADSKTSIEIERNWEKDIMSIGRRTAFGLVVCSLFY